MVFITGTLLGGHPHNRSLVLSLKPFVAVACKMPQPSLYLFELLGPQVVPDLEGCGAVGSFDGGALPEKVSHCQEASTLRYSPPLPSHSPFLTADAV